MDTAEKVYDLEQRFNAMLAGSGAGAWSSYTPAWTGLSNLGTAGLVQSGRFFQVGKLVVMQANLTAGTGTSLGTGAIGVGLPRQVAANINPHGSGSVQGSGAFKPLMVTAAPSATAASVFGLQASTTIQFASPGTAGYPWVAGDQMIVTMTYEAA